MRGVQLGEKNILSPNLWCALASLYWGGSSSLEQKWVLSCQVDNGGVVVVVVELTVVVAVMIIGGDVLYYLTYNSYSLDYFEEKL